MHQSICVVFDQPRVARRAGLALRRSVVGDKAESVSVHYRRMIDGKLSLSQTRPGAGAFWGALSMALLGAAVLVVAFGIGDEPAMAPWMAVVMGAAFGGGVGGLAGALVGTTEPEPMLAEAEHMLQGHAAVVAEFSDPDAAGEAQRLLMSHAGARAAS